MKISGLLLVALPLLTVAFAQDPAHPPVVRQETNPVGFPTPATNPSSDGTQLKATDPPGTALYTVDGTWTFGSVNGSPATSVLLNGADTRGRANLLQVDNGGKMYQLATTGIWWLWSGGDASHGWWSQTTAPPTPKPPEPKPQPPVPVGAAHVAIYWPAVTQNADGSPATVDHYNLYLGTTSGNYGPPITVTGTNYEMGSQPPGVYYVTISTVAKDGTVGNQSAELQFLVVAPQLTCTGTQATIGSDGLTVALTTTCQLVWPTPGAYKYASCAAYSNLNGIDPAQAHCMEPPIGTAPAEVPPGEEHQPHPIEPYPWAYLTVPSPISTPPTSPYPPSNTPEDRLKPVVPVPHGKKHAP
jgi:hypothetical protein